MLLPWLVLALAPAMPAAARQDPLPDYDAGGTSAAELSGTLISTGSDTLANLMTLWSEALRAAHPGVRIQVQAAGSASAPPALTQGTVNIAPMSRPMKAGEIDAFRRRHGYAPTAVRVAVDAFAVYVHRDNPLPALTLEQLDAVFSSTRRCGYAASIDHWGAVGLNESWARRPIQPFGRNAVSGSYGFFKQHALCAGDFKSRVAEQPGSASVVQAVGAVLGGIGYSGIGYRTSAVRALPLREYPSGPAIAPTPANALAGRYPLWRYLYVYLNKPPGAAAAPLERAFVDLVLSRQGQEIVLRDGYVPLPVEVVLAERRAVL